MIYFIILNKFDLVNYIHNDAIYNVSGTIQVLNECLEDTGALTIDGYHTERTHWESMILKLNVKNENVN